MFLLNEVGDRLLNEAGDILLLEGIASSSLLLNEGGDILLLETGDRFLSEDGGVEGPSLTTASASSDTSPAFTIGDVLPSDDVEIEFSASSDFSGSLTSVDAGTVGATGTEVEITPAVFPAGTYYARARLNSGPWSDTLQFTITTGGSVLIETGDGLLLEAGGRMLMEQ
jgi:hypothetical protein